MVVQPSVEEGASHFLEIAARAGGRPLTDVTAEFNALASGPGRITAEEYVKFELHDSARYSSADKQAFLSDTLHWPIVRRCCDMSWLAVTEDKWVAAKMLASSGLPTPQIIAVAGSGPRMYPGAQSIRSLAHFRRFLDAWQGRPFFGKRLRGVASEGIFLCERYDRKSLFLAVRGEVGIEAFYASHIAPHEFIFQPVQRNHAFFEGLCHHLATARIGALVYPDGVRLAFTFLKMPGPGHVEDRFHPVGNIACELAPETGEILSIRQRTALGAETCPVHPETGRPLIGLRVPWWEQLKEAVAIAARVFAPVCYQTYDIALGPDGPVILEINIGGGFGGPQLVMQRGLLHSPFGHFLRHCGIDLGKVPPRRGA